MYEELIKGLRETDFSDGCPCGAEPMCQNEDCIIAQAADAIEQLSADLERSNDYEAFWKEEAEEALRRYRLVVADKPRWISVEERLPYESGYYLIVTHSGLTDDAEDWMKDNAVDVTMAHYADYSNIWTTDSGAAYNADLSKCDKTRYEYVTHWMPLPQPPEEEA